MEKICLTRALYVIPETPKIPEKPETPKTPKILETLGKL